MHIKTKSEISLLSAYICAPASAGPYELPEAESRQLRLPQILGTVHMQYSEEQTEFLLQMMLTVLV